MFVDALIFLLLVVCVSDQEGGRWRSVSPEGALRVGLRSGGGGGGAGRSEVEMGESFSVWLGVRGGAHP